MVKTQQRHGYARELMELQATLCLEVQITYVLPHIKLLATNC